MVISGLSLQDHHTGLPRVCQISLWPLYVHISDFQLLPITHQSFTSSDQHSTSSTPWLHPPEDMAQLSVPHLPDTVCPFCFPVAPYSLCLPEGIQDLVQRSPHQEALARTMCLSFKLLSYSRCLSYSALHCCCLHIYGLYLVRLSGPRGQGSGT